MFEKIHLCRVITYEQEKKTEQGMIRDKGNPLTALRTHLGLECEEQVKETQGSYYQRTPEGTRGGQV